MRAAKTKRATVAPASFDDGEMRRDDNTAIATAPASDLQAPSADALPWDDGQYSPSPSYEGTASFLRDRGYGEYQPSTGSEIRQEPVSYDRQDPSGPSRFAGADRQSASACEPPKRRGLRLRKKRTSETKPASFASPSGDQEEQYPTRPASSADTEMRQFAPAPPPFDWDTPPMETESHAGTQEAVDDDGQTASPSAGMSGEGNLSAPNERTPDGRTDNTPAQMQDQEKDETNFGRDGSDFVLSHKDGSDTPTVQEKPQPTEIRSYPPTGKSDAAAMNNSYRSESEPPMKNREEAAMHSSSGQTASAFAPPPIPRPAPMAPPPTRMEVEDYRQRLEMRLLERYNNMPDHAGKVGKVTIVLSKPLQLSLDGSMIRAEFDQLVFDPWGKRIPELEEEYYVVTFGSGGARQVRADPSIRVGLDLEKAYSERVPLSADPFSRLPDDGAFRSAPAPDSAPRVKMPSWWRPDFPELQ